MHDFLLQTHREEKIARATSATILVEQKAAKSDPNTSEGNSETSELPHEVETEGAKFENGKVTLKGNPLITTKEIRCGKCGLPRLLHPTDGNGAKKPEPGVEYCKKRPFIDKPYHDIYGQTFVPEGPGRGKKKKDMVNPLIPKEGTPNGSQDSPNPSPPPGEGPAKPIPFPHAKCQNCGTFLPIKRMNNHMVKCIGGGGRDSSRNALLKIQSNGNGSQNGYTSGGSRTGTPAPSSQQSINKNRTSPNKRDAEDDLESDSPVKKLKKAGIKKTAATKLKAPKMQKSASKHSASNLSFEQKAPQSDDEDQDDDGDDDRDGDFGRDAEAKKKKLKPVKKLVKPKSKFTHYQTRNPANIFPVSLNSGDTIKVKVKSEINGKIAVHGGSRDESESSQTLSSPN